MVLGGVNGSFSLPLPSQEARQPARHAASTSIQLQFCSKQHKQKFVSELGHACIVTVPSEISAWQECTTMWWTKPSFPGVIIGSNYKKTNCSLKIWKIKNADRVTADLVQNWAKFNLLAWMLYLHMPLGGEKWTRYIILNQLQWLWSDLLIPTGIMRRLSSCMVSTKYRVELSSVVTLWCYIVLTDMTWCLVVRWGAGITPQE